MEIKNSAVNAEVENNAVNNEQEKIVLSPEIQNEIMKFFMRTSIPRKAKEERLKKARAEALSGKKEQEQ